MKTCANCNAANLEDAQFCQTCGRSMVAAEAAPLATSMFGLAGQEPAAAPRAPRPAHPRRRLQPHGPRTLGHRRRLHHHRHPPHRLHVAGNPRRADVTECPASSIAAVPSLPRGAQPRGRRLCCLEPAEGPVLSGAEGRPHPPHHPPPTLAPRVISRPLRRRDLADQRRLGPGPR